MSSLYSLVRGIFPTVPAGSSLTDVMTAMQTALLQLIPTAEALFGPKSGPEKKEAVLVAMEKFYDTTIAPLDIPYLPNVLIEPYVDKQIRTLIRPVFGPAIDAIVLAYKSHLVVPAPVVPAVPVTPPAPSPLPPLDPDHEGVG